MAEEQQPVAPGSFGAQQSCRRRGTSAASRRTKVSCCATMSGRAKDFCLRNCRELTRCGNQLRKSALGRTLPLAASPTNDLVGWKINCRVSSDERGKPNIRLGPHEPIRTGLLHWRKLPIALAPGDGAGISCRIESYNEAGLPMSDGPAMFLSCSAGVRTNDISAIAERRAT